MENRKVKIHLYGNDRLDYYNIDSRTNIAEDGLIEQVQSVLGAGFKVSIEATPTGEETEELYLVIERL